MPESSEENKSTGRLLKITNIVILVLLLGVTALLALQNWRLRQELVSARQSAVERAAPPPAASLAPATVAPVIPAEKKPVPAPVAAAKKPASPAPAKPNYTQPAKELTPPVAARTEPLPAPVARVMPTDVIPAEPLPFPASEPLAPPQLARIRATIASGTVLTVRLLDTLNTDRNQSGDRFRASLEEPIISEGNVIVPRGTTVEGRIVDAQQAGRVKGVAEMTLELSQLRLSSGETVVLETGTIRREGETSTGEDAAKVGTGAAIGAVIGAIGGGRKGAAVGAATGAGAGTAGVLLTRGEPLILGQETILSFQLNAPLTMEVVPGQAPDASFPQPQRRPPAPGDWDRDRPILRRR
ncbi:MAG: hypothetical protein HY316_03830 [Acidobacteria bacterium]|nr:hypothetical protein [Acidobacteriota bacterium]